MYDLNVTVNILSKVIYSVSYNFGSPLFFYYFVSFYSTKIRKLGEF